MGVPNSKVAFTAEAHFRIDSGYPLEIKARRGG